MRASKVKPLGLGAHFVRASSFSLIKRKEFKYSQAHKKKKKKKKRALLFFFFILYNFLYLSGET